MKRTIATTLTGLMLLCGLLVFNGCASNKAYENTFYYGFRYDIDHQNRHAYITRLTEYGETLKAIYIPDYIDGYPVKYVGLRPLKWGNYFYCDNAMRVYLPSSIINSYIIIKNDHLKVIQMKSENPTDDGFYSNPYFSQLDSIEKVYAEVRANKYTNVTYLYNYENAPNNGIFLLDDYDNEPILYPPEISPARDGYRFAGWYKEKECTTPWDFSKDIIPQKDYFSYEAINSDGFIYTAYKQKLLVTQLFAKWEKID